jgi:hypothetical protein
MMLSFRITVTNSDTYANLAGLGFGVPIASKRKCPIPKPRCR